MSISERDCLEKMKSEGVMVTELKTEDKAKFIEATKSVQGILEEKNGKEIMDLARSSK